MNLAYHKVAPKRIEFALVLVFIGIMTGGMVMPVLPDLVEQMTGSNARAGLVNGWFVAIFAGMQFLFSPVIGSLADKYGRRPIFLVSTACVTLDFVLVALAPSLWWIALGRFVSGVSASLHTMFAYMADITDPDKRARSYGFMGATMTVGLVAGPITGGLLSLVSPRAPFWGAAAIAAMGFIYVLIVVPESLSPEKRMNFKWRRANPFGALTLLGGNIERLALGVVFFFLSFTEPLFQSIFVLYCGYRYEWSPLEIGGLFAMGGLLSIIVQAGLVGRAVALFGERKSMIIGVTGGAIGVVWMGLAPTGGIFLFAMFPYALIGLAMPNLQSLITQRVSESEQGQLQGALNVMASMAGVAAPLAFGFVYSISVGPNAIISHPGTAFFLSATTLVLAGLTAVKLIGSPKTGEKEAV
jgi:DHA1 family tetracycline resistance protein-like MFS transporter